MGAAPSPWTYEQCRSGIVSAARAGDRADLELGRWWHRLTHEKLWVGHYSSAKEFLDEELGGRGLKVPTPRTLERIALVGITFDGDDPGLGWMILLLALEYWAHLGYRTFSRDNPGDEIIKVPQPDGSVLEKPLRTCRQADLNAALRQFRKKGPPELSAKDLALEKLLQSGLDKLVGANGHGSIHLLRKNGQRRFKLMIEADEGRLGGLLDLLKL